MVGTAGVILAQFVHHGSDHRAQVGTIVGAHGVEPPNVDVWSFGEAVGEVAVDPQRAGSPAADLQDCSDRGSSVTSM